MILGVMSDTHGNLPLMFRAADLLTGRFGAEVLVHLGDDWEDGAALAAAGRTVWAVPGLWCEAYRSWRVPNARCETVDGVVLAFAHDTRDLARVRAGALVLLTGHTHEAEIRLAEGVLHMNPGHLKRSRDRGEDASFGVVEITPERITCAVHELDGTLRMRESLARDMVPEGPGWPG